MDALQHQKPVLLTVAVKHQTTRQAYRRKRGRTSDQMSNQLLWTTVGTQHTRQESTDTCCEASAVRVDTTCVHTRLRYCIRRHYHQHSEASVTAVNTCRQGEQNNAAP